MVQDQARTPRFEPDPGSEDVLLDHASRTSVGTVFPTISPIPKGWCHFDQVLNTRFYFDGTRFIVDQGSGHHYPGHTNNRWYTTPGNVLAAGPATAAANVISFLPVVIGGKVPRTFDRIGYDVVVAGASGASQLGLYTSDDQGLPDKLIVDAGLIVHGSMTGAFSANIDETFLPGTWIWTAFVTTNATPQFASLSGATGFVNHIGIVTYTDLLQFYYFAIFTAGPLPATAPTPMFAASAGIPLVRIRAKADL